MHRHVFTVVVAAFALVVVACVNRVGQSCTTSDDCGTHEVCSYLPVACNEPCATQGVCNQEATGNEPPCGIPPSYATSCASGMRLAKSGCGVSYFTEPVRHYGCP